MTDADAAVENPAEETADDNATDNAVAQAPMDDLVAEGQGTEEPGSLDNILDIPVTISVQIGTTAISIRNLLQLNQGSVVELDRLAGEPLDVLVNGTLVAHGEVVVVNEKFGIRLTDVVSARERVAKLS
ncbi:MAG: flagellar motor switch protein FliN [Pseudomonadota bacterium]